MKLKVAVLGGGPSPEYEISLQSADVVWRNLDPKKFLASKVIIPQSGGFSLEKLKDFDLAFIAMHGPFGEDGTIQGLLDEINLPYTGSSAKSSRLGMDKLASKKIFSSQDIPVPRFLEAGSAGEAIKVDQEIGFPLVVKPSNQGSSVGVSVVSDKNMLKEAFAEAASYGPVLVEEFVVGRELTVGILVDVPLPVVEIRPRRGFFDYRSKYDPNLVEEVVPAPLTDLQVFQAQNLAMRSFQALGCRGFSRVDMILCPSGEMVVLEVNTIPGLTENSLFPKELKAQGIKMKEALEMIICA